MGQKIAIIKTTFYWCGCLGIPHADSFSLSKRCCMILLNYINLQDGGRGRGERKKTVRDPHGLLKSGKDNPFSFAKNISLPMGARHCNCGRPKKGIISLSPLIACKMLDFCYTALRSNLVKALTVKLIGLNPDITCEGTNRYNSCDGMQFCNGGRKGGGSVQLT